MAILTLSEMADEADHLLTKIEQEDSWTFNSDELSVLEDIFEFVIQQAQKRERRRDRAKNAKATEAESQV